MKTIEIIEYLESIFPLNEQEEWDNCGLLVEGEEETDNILLSLSLTKDVIKKAIEMNSKFIICHHPLFFKDWSIEENSLFDKIKTTEIIKLLKNHGIAFYSLHTNYDKVLMNEYLLKILDLNIINSEKLDNVNEIGIIGEVDNSLYLKDFITILKDKFNIKDIRVSNIDLNRNIKRIGICGGSGKDFLDSALLKADVFVTGDLKFHTAIEAKKVVFDIGHFESEIFAPKLLKKITEVGENGVIADEKSPFI